MIEDQDELVEELQRANKSLKEANVTLTSENSVLKQQVSYF